MKRLRNLPPLALLLVTVPLGACDEDTTGPGGEEPLDPDDAPVVAVDRFSQDAGMLFVRDGSNGLPAANEPVDFDQAPFITHGLGPGGELVSYYNFDVQPTAPAPIYVLFREGESSPVPDQLNIIDVIPGEPGYNDFWQVMRVTVPESYVANTVTSFAEIQSRGFEIEPTTTLVNCPVVPAGSTADMSLEGGPNELIRGWYRDQVVNYFSFVEADLATTDDGEVPRSPIWVSFNVNPPDGGPADGFVTEEGTAQTHNILATLPEDAGYSPLWHVNVYDNADFFMAFDLESVDDLDVLAEGVTHVNCPVVAIDEDGVTNPNTATATEIDRFSEDAGELFVRDGSNGLPGAGEPVDFDQAPFITHGLGPDGTPLSYYNFDVQALAPAPIYVLFREGQDEPVEGQLNIVDVVPGEPGYNDFWQVVRVTVPADYVANTVTSFDEIMEAGYETETTDMLVNCPIVPAGSTAELRLGGDEEEGLIRGWYRGEVIYYFSFFEAAIETTGDGEVPRSPIWVAFNINPGDPGGGPSSGFVTEAGNDQTHNVVATVPGDDGYSPLWHVNVYDNADFDAVDDLASAMAATTLAEGVAHVNCPIVDFR